MGKLSVEAGKSAALTANAFKRDGYTFSGWSTAKDGSGTAYADKATVTPASDLTLYAQRRKAAASSTTSRTSTARSSLSKTGDPAAPVAAAAALALAGAGTAAAGLLRRRRQR